MKTLEPIFSIQSLAIYLTLSRNTTDLLVVANSAHIVTDEIKIPLQDLQVWNNTVEEFKLTQPNSDK